MHQADRRAPSRWPWGGHTALLFCVAVALLLLGMSAMPGTYDEGIVLTGALRTMAGQLPHQDFYANYGPLSYYALGWLFRLFGVSLLCERVLFAVVSGLIVTTMYVLAGRYCSPRLAQGTALSAFLSFGLQSVSGSAMYPAALLNLVCVALVLLAYVEDLSIWMLGGSGMLTAVAWLVRYDTGTALFGVVVVILGFAIFVRERSWQTLCKEFASSVSAYTAGFTLIVLPAVLYYLAHGRFQAYARDILIYPRRYYPRARGLPFPGVHFNSPENLAVYLPLVIAVLAIVVGVRGCLARGAGDRPASGAAPWHPLVASYGLLSLVMYLKGIVRASPAQMYLSLLPAILLVAVLCEHRTTLRRPLWLVLPWLFVLCASMGVFGAVRELHARTRHHALLPVEMLAQLRGTLPPVEAAWCRTPSPLTRGICFLPDDDRIQTIEFIRAHTTVSDKLYVGVTHHDRIFGNDNITYFASQRLPVTKWSHFDPFLQNSLPIQQQMVQEFEAAPPPYIVLDAEFDDIREPNESSRSSGVTLLDDYLHSHYASVQTYGLLSIWKRETAAH